MYDFDLNLWCFLSGRLVNLILQMLTEAEY